MGQEAKRRGTVRQLHRELTRSRLAEAAVECFSSSGYVATTIDDITAAAGTTRATFYLHFKSKADVVIEALRRLDAEYEPVYAALVELAEAPTREKVRAWLEGTVQVWERTGAASAAATEAALLEPAVRERQQVSFERDIELLGAALQKSGRWSPGEARARAIVLFSQLQQLFLRWSMHHGWDVDRGEIVSVLALMWSAALGCEEPGGTSS
ncbi:TetR/AcrR family transcriptional regulator [Saccharopolyspora sp. NPDC000995]